MLVLERKTGQSLTITAPDGTVITVTITEIGMGKAYVGIDAPREWKISRG